jgi:hypothetical protein
MNRSLCLLALAIICGLYQTPASAQVGAPFFGGGAVAFDPEISIINSGALLDAQGVASHDRKYVTINVRTTNTALLALQTFSINSGVGGGFVGGTPPVPSANTQPNATPATVNQTSPAAIANAARPPIVQQRGTTLLMPLKP